MAFLKSLFPFLVCIISFNVFPQTDSVLTYNLSEVVISATKTQTSALEVASSISVINRDEILNSKKIFLFDLLKSVPGITFNQQGGMGKFASVYIRGGNPGHTLVLIDGIEINMPNDPASSVDFSTLPVDDIERIEILRGPQSTLYGSDALAGVINIISKKGSGKPKIFLSSEGGSYNTFNGSAGVSGSIDFLNYSASLAQVTTEGFSSASEKYGNTEKDGHSGLHLSTRLGADFTDYFNLSIIYRHNKAETDYDQFGGMFGDDPTYIFNLEENIFRSEANFNLFDKRIESKAGISYFKNVRKYSFDSTLNNLSSSTSFYNGNKIKIDWLNNFEISDGNIISLGFETEQEKAYTEYFIFSSTFPFESILPESKSRTSGIFLQAQTKIGGGFFGNAGLRIDKHDRFGSSFTYRIAPAYIFWQTGTKLKATLGTGFKTPSLFYLFDPAFGNSELNPEKNIGWDAGVEQFFFNSKLIIGATYFSNRFTDLFGFDDSFKTININEAETSGIEFYFKAIPAEDISVEANYTFTASKDLSPGSDDEGEKLIRRPEHKAALIFNHKIICSLNYNFEFVFVGEREDKDFSKFPAERITLKNYTLVNFAASFDLLDAVQIYGRVENLFDIDYEEVLGYATPALSFYGGLRLNF